MIALLALLLFPVFLFAQSTYDHYNDAYFTGDGSLPNLVEANGLGSKTSFGLPPPPSPTSSPPLPMMPPSLGAKESQMQAPPPTTPQLPVIETEEELVQILEESGAISGVASLPGSTETLVDFSSYSGASFRIVVDGAKVRGLLGSVSVEDILKLWRSGSERQKRGRNISTGEYYALIAATLAEDDARLDRAEFTNVHLEVTYRSRGALLWFVPWSFPVRITIGMDMAVKERVAVKLPWYHWFLREYFTRASLAEKVTAVVSEEESKGGGEGLQLRIFMAVTAFLKKEVRTISDSILLGS